MPTLLAREGGRHATARPGVYTTIEMPEIHHPRMPQDPWEGWEVRHLPDAGHYVAIRISPEHQPKV